MTVMTQTLSSKRPDYSFSDWVWPKENNSSIWRERLIFFKGWKIYLDRYEVRNKDDHIVPFTLGEFQLLTALARAPARVLNCEYLFNITHDIDHDAFDRGIDVQIARIRKKLGDDPHHPEFIKTIRGVGYLFLPKVHYENF